MLKYLYCKEVFSEVPDEICLALSISNCQIKCHGCNQKELWEDNGTVLDSTILNTLLRNHRGITCVLFMGGDSNPSEIDALAQFIKIYYPLKVAWYSGRQELSKDINLKWFDYIKLGPYIEELGPLNSKTTNQKMYEVVYSHYEDGTAEYELNDITYKFHGKKD